MVTNVFFGPHFFQTKVEKWMDLTDLPNSKNDTREKCRVQKMLALELSPPSEAFRPLRVTEIRQCTACSTISLADAAPSVQLAGITFVVDFTRS